MAVARVKLPKFGLTMEEATVNAWLIGIGEPVERGQILATIQTEKVDVELPSPVSGIVAEHLVQVGKAVPIGTPIVVVVADEAEFEQYRRRQA